MRYGSLFMGIGLLDLGLHLAGLHDLRWVCESDEWRREHILAQRFPGAVRHADVLAVGAGTVEPVDLIVGGFPCKGASTAGKRTGFDHPETVLWREMARAVGELDRATSCWRTWRTSLLSKTEPSGERFSGTWPRSGSMLSGIAYRREPSAPRISATGSSPLLPTPRAQDRQQHNSKDNGVALSTAVRLLPTPAATEYRNNQSPSEGAAVRPSLDGLVRLLPTPTADGSEGKQMGANTTRWRGVNSLGPLSRTLAEESTSTGRSSSPPSDAGKPSTALRLNPSFVEWMIGAPHGWSDPACPLSATEFKCKQA